MQAQIEKTRDDEARLLARVYALILSFSNDADDDAQAETRGAERTRVNTQRAKSEVKNDEK